MQHHGIVIGRESVVVTSCTLLEQATWLEREVHPRVGIGAAKPKILASAARFVERLRIPLRWLSLIRLIDLSPGKFW